MISQVLGYIKEYRKLKTREIFRPEFKCQPEVLIRRDGGTFERLTSVSGS